MTGAIALASLSVSVAVAQAGSPTPPIAGIAPILPEAPAGATRFAPALADAGAVSSRPAPAATVRFGVSGAVNVLITPTGAPLNPVALAPSGSRWDRGHQWFRAGWSGSGTPRPIGGPVLPGATEPVISPPASAPRAEPAPRPAPRLLGVPARQPGDETPPESAEPVLELAPVTGPSAGESAEAARPAPSGDVPTRDPVSPAVPAGVPIVAPNEPGIWMLENAEGVTVTVVTLVSASRVRGGRLNGYHIGMYPTAGSERADLYSPPTGFIEVTPENRDLRVSEHLTVGQFLTKDQVDVWPKYVALDMRLIDKLELVIQELNAMGVRASRVHVMSGFRTPQYNGPGGDGRAALSRHMWGDAADMWIDDDGDGMMDDLNGDGEVNFTDASLIMRAVDRVEARHPGLVGGAGLYAGSDVRGPYIHIDARGHHARW